MSRRRYPSGSNLRVRSARMAEMNPLVGPSRGTHQGEQIARPIRFLEYVGGCVNSMVGKFGYHLSSSNSLPRPHYLASVASFVGQNQLPN